MTEFPLDGATVRVHSQFTGGNIIVDKVEGSTVFVKCDLRTTTTDWFYWAFCVEGAQGKTLRFCFDVDRLGYYGPAISNDLQSWRWFSEGGIDDHLSFSYTFKADENKVYFAHNMLYHPDRFFRFASQKGWDVNEFCVSEKGRSVPYITFGNGEKVILLTARHHACEAPGNYVLEGVLDYLSTADILKYRFICVPFIDYDGVVDGDQGKNRAPHDHNRDYTENPIYATTRAMKAIVDSEPICFAADFHAPWHYGGDHDFVFIVQNNPNKVDLYQEFGKMLEENLPPNTLKYDRKNQTNWQHETHRQFAGYTAQNTNCVVSFSLETTYFGESDNIFTQARGVAFGRVFAKVMLEFLQKERN